MDKRKILKYFLFYVFTIISSIVAVILYLKYYPVESKVITETINKSVVSEQGVEEAIKGVYDSVVTVQSYYNGELVGTGSGFVYKKDDNFGYVLTNNHVIESATEYKLLLQNGEEVDAKLLGSDEYSDLAVLSMDKDKVIKVASLGDSDLIEVGNTVFTVGSPMGSDYSGSVTRGIVSSKERTVETDSVVTKVIQTDAAINPGNSGGPLVNLAGDVIGITSMKLATEEVEGMGFAIPINDAKLYVQSLENGEKIARPILGVSLINVNDRYALYRNRISISSNIQEGVVIADLQDDGAASKAGLKIGDVITKMDDKDISSVSKLRYYLYQYSIGDKVKVTYIRNNKTLETTVKLEGN